jgi:hypothetical protein
LFDRAALDVILKQVESAAQHNDPRAPANPKIAATSIVSSRTGTTANTPERQP